MGLSSSTTKSSTKPVYDQQITGAANSVSSAYNAAQPGIASSAAAIGETVPGLIDKYTNGDPGVNAATGYNTDVLSGKYLTGNPQLDAMIAQTGNHTRNGVEASLGTRGLAGGSAYADIVSRALAENETGLRYSDYNNERGRMDAAAGRAPATAAAQYLPLTAAIDAAGAQEAPVRAAAGYGSSIGGLLGQYTNQTQKTGTNIGMLIAQLAGNAASAYAGGG